MLKRFMVCIIILVIFLFDMLTGLAQSTELGISLHHSWGGEGNVLNHGIDLKLTSEGDILVVNSHFNRITRIVPGEEKFFNFGGFGFSDGQLVNVSGITTDSNGNIYVAGDRIYIFTSEGEYLRSIWSYDDETGNADQIRDIAVDLDYNLHVIAAYGDKNTIKTFSSDGTLMNQWTTPIGDIPLLMPLSIEMTPDNNLIISEFGADYDRDGRVVICDTQGNFIKAISQVDTFEYLDKPLDVAISSVNGHIFVVDVGKNQIFEFSADGETLINRWGSYGETPGFLYYPWSIEFDSEGNLLVLSPQHNIQVFTPEGEYIRSFGVTGKAPGQFKTPFDILISETGIVYVADSNNNRIQAFDQNGTFLFEWSLGEGWARSISEDSAGIIYVTLTDEICKYNGTEGLQSCWGETGTDSGQFTNLTDVVVQTVAIDSVVEELVYTTEYIDNLKRIQIFTTDGTFIRTFLVDDYLTRLVIDNSGIIFGLNWQGDKIFKYNTNGEKLAETSLLGFEASAISFGNNGLIYLVDQHINRIHQMEPTDLTINQTWMGEFGDVSTYFWSSYGFDFSDDGLLYLIDVVDARVLVFELEDDGHIQSSETSILKDNAIRVTENLIQNGGFENELISANWTFVGPLPFQRSSQAHSGNYALQIGEFSHQGQAHSQAYTTITIPENFQFPVLSFYYQIQSADAIDLADMYVEVQDGVGLNHLTKVVHSGSGFVEGNWVWNLASISLSAFRGETIRINFLARNRTDASSGILVLIDDVQVISEAENLFLPLINH